MCGATIDISRNTSDTDPRKGRRAARWAVPAAVMGFAVAVLALGLGVANASTPVAPRVGSNFRLDSGPTSARGLEAPGLAADPADQSHLVAVDEDLLGGHCDFHVSFDGGATWTGGHLAAPPDFPAQPCVGLNGAGYPHMDESVVFGSAGNVYAVFDSRQSAQSRDSVLVAGSNDGGRHFATAVVAVSGTSQTTLDFVRAQLGVLAKTGGDTVYVSAWGTAPYPAVGNHVFVARSTDNGRSWSPPTDVGGPASAAIEPSPPVVSPDGSVHLAWRTLDAAGAAHQLMEANSSDGGQTWQQAVVGPVTGVRRTDPKMAGDPRTGTLYLVYQYGSLQGEGQALNLGNPDIYLRHSIDGGATWSAPVRVNDDTPGRGVDHRSPHLSVAPDGRVDIVWFDRRNAQTPVRPECNNPLSRPGEGDVYLASSTDGGVTASPNRRVTDRLIDWDVGFDCRIASSNLLGPAVASLGNGGVLAAWADSRDGSVRDNNQDIYLGRFTTQPLAVTQVKKAAAPVLSVALSQLAYPGGAEFVGGNAINSSGGQTGPFTTSVVVVNENDVAGALAGAVLARVANGPLLLSPVSGLTTQVANEVSRLGPAGAYVIAGPSSLSTTVESNLRAAGVSGPVLRIEGTDTADLARRIAETMASAAKATGAAAVDTAVVVDPTGAAASAGSDLAASLRLPVLFISKNQVPAATTEALTAMGIAKTIVVGDTGSISDAVTSRLPSPQRLGGADAVATSVQVAQFALGRLPHNVVYAAPPSQPVVSAALGAAVARLGGTMVLASGAGQTEQSIDTLGVTASVDRVVLVGQTATAAWRSILPVAAFIFAALGVVFFVLARRAARRRTTPTTDA